MFISQSGQGRHDIHRERIVPEDVESTPAESCQFEKAARYLKRERQCGQLFEYGKMAEVLAAFTDSDLAGCKETRKSSSAHLESHIDFGKFRQGEDVRVPSRKRRHSRHRTSSLHGTNDKSSQSTMIYDDDIRKDLHARGLRETAQKHGTFAVDGFDFAEKMDMRRRPVTVTPQRRALARLRVVL